MKKIVGFQNKGGMRLKRELEIYDEEIIRLVGKKGMKRLVDELKIIATQRKLGSLVYYPIEDVFTEIDETTNSI